MYIVKLHKTLNFCTNQLYLVFVSIIIVILFIVKTGILVFLKWNSGLYILYCSMQISAIITPLIFPFESFIGIDIAIQ